MYLINIITCLTKNEVYIITILNTKLCKYQTAINKILKIYGNDYTVFNDSKEAKIYFDKYSYTKNTFTKDLKDTLICYSGEYCLATNEYLNNRRENETPEQYDDWRSSIINKCIKNLYNYDNWVEIDDNVLAVRYINLGKNKLRTTSKTIVSCSLNFNVMEDVFQKNDYFKGVPYQMGLSDTMLIILINKGTKFLSYEQLDDYCSIKQSELLLPQYTEFSILDHFRIFGNKIKNIYIVTPKNI